MHQASPDISTWRLPDSGTAAQNWRSRTSECDSTFIPGGGHFLFARFQKLAKRFELVAHAVEHLANGVDANFAALEAVERKFDRKIFREAQQRALVHFCRGRGGRHAGQRLPQCYLRILRQRGHSLLPNGRIVLRGLGVLRFAELNEQAAASFANLLLRVSKLPRCFRWARR